MSMLAEPRRFRKKYNLVPRGKALFEDDNRFGTKMLERMGWTKGKGLGAREDGSQEFVRVRYKNDANGMGYEERDDQWTEHEKLFNGLLTSLNNSEANSEIEEDDHSTTRIGFGYEPTKEMKDNVNVKDKISGESLEEKSKQSKSRVHYKKFTKGKDLSQYSEKDLANIFGKKTETTVFQKFEPIVITEENTDDSKKFGITTINTGTSVTDYFKEKMEAIKRKRMGVLETNDDCPVTILDKENKKKNKKKNRQDNSQEESSNSEIIETLEVCKKKEQKKNQIEELPVENIFDQPEKTKRNLEIIINNEEKPLEKSGKRQKKKNKYLENNENEKRPEETLKEVTAEKPKKKKRNSENNVNNEEKFVEDSKENNEQNLKRKKKKFENTVNDEEKSTEIFEEIAQQKSKKKKMKLGNNEEKSVENLEEIIDQKPKKKKRNLENIVNNETNLVGNSEEITAENYNKTKKKLKNLKNYEEVGETNMPEDDKEKIKNFELNIEKPNNIETTKSEKKKKKSQSSPSNDNIPEKPVSEQIENSVYKISEYCAEKFRHTDLNRFPGSNISEIVGYGLENDMKMEIVNVFTDMENITNLWSKVYDSISTDKYKQYSKCPLKKYAQQVKKAKIDKKKIPKINIKRFKKKSIFKSI